MRYPYLMINSEMYAEELSDFIDNQMEDSMEDWADYAEDTWSDAEDDWQYAAGEDAHLDSYWESLYDYEPAF